MLNWASCLFAFLAAVLWWISAYRSVSYIRDSMDHHIADTNAAISVLRSQDKWRCVGCDRCRRCSFFLQALSFLGLP